MIADWSTTPCSACGESIDLTQRHVSVVSQVEAHDPPGHVMSIGYSTQVASYHLHDVPAHLDGRREDDLEGLAALAGHLTAGRKASSVTTTEDGPLAVVRVGPVDGGYLVGPFTLPEAVAWREENVTIPGMQWAIMPLLPPAARPAGADLFPPVDR